MDAVSSGLPVTVWTGGLTGSLVGTRSTAGGTTGGFVSTAWATANVAYYLPMWLPFRYPVRNLFVYNFATVNGNVDVGIYNSDLAKLTPAVTTAQAGASGLQFFAVDVVLDPGQYYFAMSSSSTTATFGSAGLGSATRQRYFGVLQQATAHPLPVTATPAAVSTARFPLIGATYQTGTPNF